MGEMVKTTKEYCRSCIYSTIQSKEVSIVPCEYLYMTGKLRGCKVGECDKYEPRYQGYSNKKKYF